MINGEEVTDSAIIANTVCKYLTDIGPSLAKNIKMPENFNAKDFLTGKHSSLRKLTTFSILGLII